MKKKSLLILLLTLICIILSLLFVGCKIKNKSPNEVANFLKDMDSYTCDINIEIINDKQTLNYDVKEMYHKKYGYRVEIGQDRLMIYKDDKIYVTDIKNAGRYTADKEFDKLYRLGFIGEFIGLLYTNEEYKYSFKNIDGIDYELIELLIPGGNREMNKAVMYVNKKTSLPEKLQVFNDRGKEKIEFTYKNFIAFADVKQELFSTDEEINED